MLTFAEYVEHRLNITRSHEAKAMGRVSLCASSARFEGIGSLVMTDR